MIGLYYDTNRFKDALALGGTLLKELKKLDDKNLLVEVRQVEFILSRNILKIYPKHSLMLVATYIYYHDLGSTIGEPSIPGTKQLAQSSGGINFRENNCKLDICTTKSSSAARFTG